MHINLNIINDKGVSVNKGQKYYEHFFPQALEEVKDTKSDAFSPAKKHMVSIITGLNMHVLL